MNMAENVNEILKELGLSEKEVKVYLALLELGEESASRVSEIANLNRVTTYTLLKSLQEKGFCSVFDKNNVQVFKPINPESIVGMLDERKRKVNSIMDELKERQNNVEEKSEVMLFEGKKGILAMLEMILDDADKEKEVFVYGNLTKGEKLIEYQSLHWRKKRLERGIRINAVVNSLKEFEPRKEKEWQKFSKWKENPKLNEIDLFVMITENLVSYITFKGELVSVLIRNKEIADKEMFNFNNLK